MVVTIVICIGIAVVLGFLIKCGTIVWLRYIGDKYLKQANDAYDEITFICEHNRDKARELLAEWRANINTDAREIWTEEELLERVDIAEKELNHELQVRDKFLRCCEIFSNTRHIDKHTECIITYHKYLVNSIEYRQNICIMPITINVSDTKEILNSDNRKYSNIIAECENKLDMLLTSSIE